MSDPRAALEAIGALPDAEIDIADAALQLARVDAPSADWLDARAHLSALAREAVALAAGIDAADLLAQAAVLAQLLAVRHGYVGDAETYDDPANANLIRVIERRRGLPVALGVLWLHAARAAGWAGQGVDFPGHFLVSLVGNRAAVFIDPFGRGRVLDAADLHALLRRADPAIVARPEAVLPAMPVRGVLLRLQNNIRTRRQQAGDLAGALACAQDMLRIAPQEAGLWRETALLHGELGEMTAALRCLGQYAALVPPEEAARAQAAIQAMRSRLN